MVFPTMLLNIAMIYIMEVTPFLFDRPNPDNQLQMYCNTIYHSQLYKTACTNTLNIYHTTFYAILFHEL